MTLGYWVEEPGRGALREVELPGPGLHLDALCTGVSPGTERLVGLAKVPATLRASMACRGMQGSFALPLLYGYSFVGVAREGEHAGRRAFVMRPHQQRVVVDDVGELVWLPDEVPSPRATLFPNLETARNAVWDAQVARDDRVVVYGAGPVGLLCSYVLTRDHGGRPPLVVDRSPERRARAAALPWVDEVATPDGVPPGAFDRALHTTATGAGLQAAIDAVGFEGAVVELSWYGDEAVTLHLGGTFHSMRKRVLCSQVGAVAPSHRAAGHDGRRHAVLALLADPQLDALLEEPAPFARAPDVFAALYRSELATLCPYFTYS